MSKNLSRRELLKLSSLLPLAYLLPSCQRKPSKPNADPNAPNILIIVFDAWAAPNNSIYGYPRENTPKISQLAEKGIVFHNNYAGGPHTTPGTATLLTGALPWSHRAFNKRTHVAAPFMHQNIFNLFDDYYRIAYSHNPFAEEYFYQFSTDVEEHIIRQELYIQEDYIVSQLLAKDFDMADLSRGQILDTKKKPTANSLFLPPIYENSVLKGREEIQQSWIDLYPRGLPSIHKDLYYLLEDGINWVGNGLPELPQPFLGYFHFLPPHNPYNTRKEFINIFYDDWQPIDKPEHLFTLDQRKPKLLRQRRDYDEYIALVDSEFDRLMGMLEKAGLRENTWVILTSDHGEMFERGIMRHSHKTLHEPVIKVPLVIFPPGQNERVDIYSRTSAIDILPTILHAANKEVSDTLDGIVLPPFANTETIDQRTVYANHLRGSPQYGPADVGTLNIYKEQYKLMYFFGHEGLPGNEPLFELYDLDNDPEEMNNLYATRKSIADELFNELITKLKTEEEQYTA